jgi:hypothetical protein
VPAGGKFALTPPMPLRDDRRPVARYQIADVVARMVAGTAVRTPVAALPLTRAKLPSPEDSTAELRARAARARRLARTFEHDAHTTGHTGLVPRRFDRIKPRPGRRVGGGRVNQSSGCAGPPRYPDFVHGRKRWTRGLTLWTPTASMMKWCGNGLDYSIRGAACQHASFSLTMIPHSSTTPSRRWGPLATMW